MDFFLTQIGIVLPVLGFDFLRRLPKVSGVSVGKSDGGAYVDGDGASLELVLRDKKFDVEANAIEVDGEIVVLAGSTARFGTENAENNYASLREQLINEGRMKPSDDQKRLVFLEEALSD